MRIHEVLATGKTFRRADNRSGCYKNYGLRMTLVLGTADILADDWEVIEEEKEEKLISRAELNEVADNVLAFYHGDKSTDLMTFFLRMKKELFG